MFLSGIKETLELLKTEYAIKNQKLKDHNKLYNHLYFLNDSLYETRHTKINKHIRLLNKLIKYRETNGLNNIETEINVLYTKIIYHSLILAVYEKLITHIQDKQNFEKELLLVVNDKMNYDYSSNIWDLFIKYRTDNSGDSKLRMYIVHNEIYIRNSLRKL